MNYSDSERIETIFKHFNFKKTDDEKSADVIIVIACAVRQSAVDRLYGRAVNWQRLKKRKKITTILSGCVLESDKIKLSKKFDYIITTKNIKKLPQIIHDQLVQKTSNQLAINDFFDVKPSYNSKFQAYVPISTGCNKKCSYCAVPYTRGPEISRPPLEIISEVKSLIQSGRKEITLLGQNVNSYGWDFQGVAINLPTGKVYRFKQSTGGDIKILKRHVQSPMNFPQLLRSISALTGDFWIRFVSSHPYDLSQDLINVVASSPNLTPYFHLAVQSGSNKILKKMNRQYKSSDYKQLIKNIRQSIPQATISTDIIVGFCDETEHDFRQTCDLVKEIKFDMAYIAQYSPRPGTPAALFKDTVKKKNKKNREKIINNLIEKYALLNNQRLIGSRQRVLIEKNKSGYAYGKTYGFKNIRLKTNKKLVGKFVNAIVTSVSHWHLSGRLIND